MHTFLHVFLPAAVTILLIALLAFINIFRFDPGMRFDHTLVGGTLIATAGIVWIAVEFLDDWCDWRQKLGWSLGVPAAFIMLFVAYLAGQDNDLNFWQALVGCLGYL